MKLLYGMINMAVTGSLVFLLFMGMEHITIRYFSAAWHYGIMKFILLYFCIPFGWLNKILICSVIVKKNVSVIPESGIITLQGGRQMVISFLSANKAFCLGLLKYGCQAPSYCLFDRSSVTDSFGASSAVIRDWLIYAYWKLLIKSASSWE
jgi:hypothetical protein